MLLDHTIFQKKMGLPIPAGLEKLYTIKSIVESMPLGFRFSNVGFVLEVQYLLAMSDSKNYDIKNLRFTFAVNTDGHELIVDLNTDTLEILQSEYGDVDSIGVNVNDLLMAERYSV